MTIKELKDILEQYPDDLEVLISDSEYGNKGIASTGLTHSKRYEESKHFYFLLSSCYPIDSTVTDDEEMKVRKS